MRLRLDAAINAEPEPSSPRTNKFVELRKLMAEIATIDPEEVTARFVGKPDNMVNRFTQPSATGRTLGVAVVQGYEREASDSDADYRQHYEGHVERYVHRGKVLVGGRKVQVMAICSRSPGDQTWDLVTLIGPTGAELVAAIRRQFPDAKVLEPVATVPGGDVVPGAGNAPPGSNDLAESLFLDQEWVDDVLWMLHDRRAVVLYGPPGTGKTFIAQGLAAHIQPDEQHRGLVQLHPSYAYEDFFEGYRPYVVNGNATLTLRWGPLRHLAKLARDNPDRPVILILDEMNRGNLPRVFGELFFLLEYRDEAMKLMYSPEETFQLPRNLYFIGTMNTADRSIAMLDQALRRRFHFVGLFPDKPPVSRMLRRYLDEHKPEMAWVAELLDEVNRRIADRNAAIGPSHFMRIDLDDAVLGRVWRASVLPTIEEYFYGRPEKLTEFSFDRLAALVRGRAGDGGAR